ALDLRLDWPRARVEGTATITFTPLRPTRVVTLDAAHLDISRITLGNDVALDFTNGGSAADDALRITLDRSYAPGEVVALRIAYRSTWVNHSDPNALGGSTGSGIRFFRPSTTEPRKRRQAWSIGEPTGNRYWFPGYDAPDDLRTTDLRFTVDTPLTVVSNGTLQGTQPNADGTRTFHWRLDVPHANHLTAFAAGEWVDQPQTVGNVTLHNFGYPDEAAAVRASVERLPEMWRWFEQVTGRPSPHGSYSQVFVQDAPWGVGAASFATLTENMIDDERTHAEYRWLWDGLEAEGAATQWFGGVVVPHDWRDAWLARAFAHYFDGLFNEHRNGREELLLWHLGGDRATYLADWAGGVRQPIVPLTRAEGESAAPGNTPLSRGALVLHMLRQQLGDSAWWKGVRHYLDRHAGQPVRTADFQRAMEAANSIDLSWFFRQWVFGIGHPVFDVTSRYDTSARAVEVVVRQVQQRDSTVSHPMVAYFEGPMVLGIGDRSETVWISDVAENVFRFPMSAAPPFVSFDRGNTWIKEVRFPRLVPELVAQLDADPDPTGKAWAITELGKRLRDTTATADERALVLSALRRFSAGPAYWRLRYTALIQLNAWVTAGDTAEQARRLDPETRTVLRGIIVRDSSWVRAQAIMTLGHARDRRDVPTFTTLLRDRFHTVNYNAAIALGQGRAPRARETLARLMREPSWKGENILAGLAGLRALGDPDAAPLALEVLRDTTATRWYLAVSRWDYRIAAAELLAALGRAELAWPTVAHRFEGAMREGDVNDIFSNVLLMATLGDARAPALFARVRERFAGNATALGALQGFEEQWKAQSAARPHP
ncbi:MAG: M1 family metallopeptidase, partial [Gemmatimonadetes bacterium]|nr:M1 family metallopeptidase [Gemmatimonadota bacterium]